MIIAVFSLNHIEKLNVTRVISLKNHIFYLIFELHFHIRELYYSIFRTLDGTAVLRKTT